MGVRNIGRSAASQTKKKEEEKRKQQAQGYQRRKTNQNTAAAKPAAATNTAKNTAKSAGQKVTYYTNKNKNKNKGASGVARAAANAVTQKPKAQAAAKNTQGRATARLARQMGARAVSTNRDIPMFPQRARTINDIVNPLEQMRADAWAGPRYWGSRAVVPSKPLTDREKAGKIVEASKQALRNKQVARQDLSPWDRKYQSSGRQTQIQDAKLRWREAAQKGDREAMDKAHREAENLRLSFGYSGGASGNEYIRPTLTQDEYNSLNKAGEDALVRKKLQWAAAQARGDTDAMERYHRQADEIRGADGYQERGRDINTARGVHETAEGRSTMYGATREQREKDAEGLKLATQAGFNLGVGGAGHWLEATDWTIANRDRDQNMEKWLRDADNYIQAQSDLEYYDNYVRQFGEAPEGMNRNVLVMRLNDAIQAREQLERMQTDPRSAYYDPTVAARLGTPDTAAYSLPQSGFDSPMKALYQAGTHPDFENPEPSFFEQMIRRGQEQQAASQEGLNAAERWVNDLYISGIQNIPTTIAAFLPGAQGGALAKGVTAAARLFSLGGMGASAAGNRLAELQDEGIPFAEAYPHATVSGMIEMATEAISEVGMISLGERRIGKLFGNVKAQPFLEAFEEAMAYLGNWGYNKAQDLPGQEFNLLDMISQAGAGLAMGALHVGAGVMVNELRYGGTREAARTTEEIRQQYQDWQDRAGRARDLLTDAQQWHDMIEQGAVSRAEGEQVLAEIGRQLLGQDKPITREQIQRQNDMLDVEDMVLRGAMSEEEGRDVQSQIFDDYRAQERQRQADRLWDAASQARTAAREPGYARNMYDRAQSVLARNRAEQGQTNPFEDAVRTGQEAIRTAAEEMQRREAEVSPNASPTVSQSTPNTETAQRQPTSQTGRRAAMLDSMASTFGESGAAGLRSIGGKMTAGQGAFVRNYTDVYNQVLGGRKESQITRPQGMTDDQYFTAVTAAQNDRKTGWDMDVLKAAGTAGRNKNAGVDWRDQYVRQMDRKTARTVDGLAKALGVRVVFAEEGTVLTSTGARANADIQGNVVTIEKNNPNPVRMLIGHELTHRMQDVSPESYQAFRDYVMSVPGSMDAMERMLARYQEAGAFRDDQNARSMAMDELAADFAGEMLENSEHLREFIRKNYEKRTVLETIRDAFRNLRDRLTGRQKAQADEAVRLLEEAITSSAKRVKEMGKPAPTRQNRSTSPRSETRSNTDEIAARQLREQAERLRDARAEMDRRMSIGEESGFKVYDDIASYTDERIDTILKEYGGGGNYAQGFVTNINPRDFLKLTISDRILKKWENGLDKGEFPEEFFPLDREKLRNNRQTPYLRVNTATGEVEGHEGRHRMLALAREGVWTAPVVLVDTATKYSKEPTAQMRLTSQDFGDGPVNGGYAVEVEDLIPTNKQYRDQIKETYGWEKAGVRFSLAGQAAQTAEMQKFRRAWDMETNGADMETIRQETGWFKGPDGHWRFEINDQGASFDPDGDVRGKMRYLDVQETRRKMYDRLNDTFDDESPVWDVLDEIDIETEHETDLEKIRRQIASIVNRSSLKKSEKEFIQEYAELDAEYTLLGRTIHGYTDAMNRTLADYLDHPELFRAYPQLRDLKLGFNSSLGKNTYGVFGYDSNGDRVITLNLGALKDDDSILDTLAHEVQHAIQHIEGFASGASPEYWDQRLRGGDTVLTKGQQREKKEVNERIIDAYINNEEMANEVFALYRSTPKMPRGKFDFEKWEQVEEDPPEWQAYDAKRDELEEKYGYQAIELLSDYYDLDELNRGANMSADELYWKTAGEVEAREVSRRRKMSNEERRKKPPKLGGDDVVVCGKQMALYANIRNPLAAANREDLARQARKMSPEYSELLDQLNALDAEYHAKHEAAKQALSDFMSEWRKENPNAGRRALWDVPQFAELFDAEDVVVEEWGEKASELSQRAKETLTRALRENGYDGVILREDSGSFGRRTDAFIALDAEQVKSATDNVGTFDRGNPDIRYSVGRGDGDYTTIKAQLREHQDELNRMSSVANVSGKSYKGAAPGALRKDIVDHMKRTGGFVVDVPGFGQVAMDEKRLNTSLDYLDTEADAIAYKAIKPVLKHGKRIKEKSNHKGREYGTVTFAAPVTINGIRGNMAVVVKQTSKYFYKMHRVLTPDGDRMDLQKKADAQPTPGGGVTANGSLATPISSASEGIVAQQGEEVKRNSLGGTEQMDAVALMRENQLLRDQLEQWKSQVKPSDRTKVKPEEVKKLARRLTKDYSTEMDTEEIAKTLQGIYDGMGRDLSYERAYEEAGKLARAMIEEASVMEDSLYRQYRDLREHFREKALVISPEMKHDISEDYGDWRKRHFGRMNLKSGDTTNVDWMFQEAAGKWPEFFNEEVTSDPAGQVLRIAEVLDSVYAVQELNPYAGDMDAAAGYLAAEIMESFWDMPNIAKTFADKAEEKLARQVARTEEEKQKRRDAVQEEREKGRARVNQEKEKGKANVQAEKEKGKAKLDRANLRADWLEAKGRHEERRKREAALAKLRKEHREKFDRAMAKAREDRDARLQAQKEKYLGKEKANSRKQKERELRAKIMRHAKALDARLERPTDKKNVPETLREAVRTLVASVNLSSRNGRPTKRTQAFLALKERLQAMQKEGEPITLDESLFGDSAEGIQGNLDAVIAMGDIPIANMSMEQLEVVWKTIRAVEHAITTYGRTLASQKYERTDAWTKALEKENETRRQMRGIGLKLDMMTPYTFFSMYGDSGLAIYRMLRDAQDLEERRVDEIAEKRKEIVSKEKVKKWSEHRNTFSVSWTEATETGDYEEKTAELTLTDAQIMELYLLSRRPQAVDHLLKGGVVQPEIRAGGKKIERGNESIPLTAEKIGEITAKLSEEQVDVAKKLQALTSYMAEWGNETTQAVYGYRKFTESNYWPIRTAREGIHSSVENSRNNPRSIKNIGMAKSTVPHASNAVDLLGVFENFGRHANEMITYATWLAPMEDANRIYNWQFRDAEGHRTNRTVKGMLDRVGGKGAQEYWANLMKDIQNGINNGSDTTVGRIANRVIGNAKGAAVGANIRVIIQQPTAIMRALAVMNPADLTAGLVAAPTRGSGWAKAKKYAGIAARKDAGGFDISSPARAMKTYFEQDTRLGKVTDAAGTGAKLADALTWGRIWNACEWQAARQNKDLRKGSSEYYRKVAEIFSEVIDQTQVVDGVLQRSQIMRSGNEILKQATSFKGEPIMGLNLLIRGWNNWRYQTDPKKRTEAKKQMARNATAFVAAAVVNALAQAVVDGLRDDDKDRKYREKLITAFLGTDFEGAKDLAASILDAARDRTPNTTFAERLAAAYQAHTGDEDAKFGEDLQNVLLNGNVAENLNLLNNIPFLSDIVSLAKGYDVNRADADVMADIIQKAQALNDALGDEGKQTVWYATAQLAAQVGKMFGIPGHTIIRDVSGVLRSWAQWRDNIPMMYEIEKAIYNTGSSKNKKLFEGIAWQALKAGDLETFNHIRADLVDSGVTDGKKLDAAMKKLAEANPDVQLPQEIKDLLGIRITYAADDQDEEAKFSAGDLNADQYEAYAEYRARTYRPLENEVLGMDAFNALGEEEKDKTLKSLWNYAEKSALQLYSGGQYEIEDSTVNAMREATEHDVTPAQYAILKGATSGIQSATTQDGETISGSASVLKREAMDKTGVQLSEEGYAYMMEKLDISGTVQGYSAEELAAAIADIHEQENGTSKYAKFGEDKKDAVKAVYEFKNDARADIGPNGKPVRGSAKAKVWAEVQKIPGLTSAQQVELMKDLGYKM